MTTPVFSVSGKDGSAGSAGFDYGGSTAPMGHHGASGGHGSAGEHGIAAGTITLQISSPEATACLPHNVALLEPIDAEILIGLKMVHPSGVQEPFDTILKVDSGEEIYLRAKGGDGGRGGDGGGGQNGGRGVPYVFFLLRCLFAPKVVVVDN